jgi:PPK2 family polyphosphate:nucleotide phosphotransferase
VGSVVRDAPAGCDPYDLQVSASEPEQERELVARARRVRELLRAVGGRGRGKADHPVPVDPRTTPGLPDELPTGVPAKAWSKAEVSRLGSLLASYQERLFANAQVGAGRRRVLLVLQAVDCGGKDGTVRSVAGAMDPLGLHIKAFGPPTEVERAHHFLWRVQQAMPPAGYVGVFNRSHYEDVLVARVRSLVAPEVWQRRYAEINNFEAAEAADGVTLIKVMLHISYEEQRERLLARLENPTKRWKFNPSDLDDRAHWHEYQQAYADVLAKCGPAHAPWYVVPADRKWYRNWAVANLLLAHLDEIGLTFPSVDLDTEALTARLTDTSESGPPSGIRQTRHEHKVNRE